MLIQNPMNKMEFLQRLMEMLNKRKSMEYKNKEITNKNLQKKEKKAGQCQGNK